MNRGRRREGKSSRQKERWMNEEKVGKKKEEK